MKLRIEADGESYLLETHANGELTDFVLTGAQESAGSASILEISPGIFSVLLGSRSFTVHISARGEELEAWTADGLRRLVTVADARDRGGNSERRSTAGPVEVRAQMPGKIVKILASAGTPVAKGDGLLVMEAMKMQNEVKSPKDGAVVRIAVQEGATVSAGDTLLVVE